MKAYPLTTKGHDYAAAVAAGDLVACATVRGACERHLRDLARTDIWWDYDASERVLQFLSCLHLTGGEFHGAFMVLFPWQCFYAGSLYGWQRHDAEGRAVRRFQMSYLETAKGSGKTPLSAGIGLYGTYADDEGGAENFCLASNAGQAGVMFTMAARMIEMDPDLLEDLEVAGGGDPHEIRYPALDATFKRITTSSKNVGGTGRSGPMPHLVLADEYHEFRNSDAFDILVAGIKSRRQPLAVITTNSGTAKDTPCGVEHDRARNVALGKVEDDQYFAFIATVDAGDDPLHDESVWEKANPSLAFGLPGLEYLRGRAKAARESSLSRPIIERLNFGIWRDQFAPWIEAEKWQPIEADELSPVELRRRMPCWLSLDMSDTKDLTALVATWRFPPTAETKGRPRFEAEAWAWLPGLDVEKRAFEDKAPYKDFAEAGDLELVHAPSIDVDAIAEQVYSLWENFNVVGLVYDSWNVRRVLEALEDLGVRLHKGDGTGLLIVDHPQTHGKGAKAFEEGRGLHMPSSTKITEEMIRERLLTVKRNATLALAVARTTIIFDGQMNPRPIKSRSTGRIDPAVALIMGGGAAWYEPKGLETMGDFEWIAVAERERRSRELLGVDDLVPSPEAQPAPKQETPFFGVIEI